MNVKGCIGSIIRAKGQLPSPWILCPVTWPGKALDSMPWAVRIRDCRRSPQHEAPSPVSKEAASRLVPDHFPGHGLPPRRAALRKPFFLPGSHGPPPCPHLPSSGDAPLPQLLSLAWLQLSGNHPQSPVSRACQGAEEILSSNGFMERQLGKLPHLRASISTCEVGTRSEPRSWDRLKPT